MINSRGLRLRCGGECGYMQGFGFNRSLCITFELFGEVLVKSSL